MDVNDIPVATVVICAFGQQDDSFITDLEDGLLGEEVKGEDTESKLPEERIKQMSTDMFATLCSQINAHRLPMYRFVSASKSYVSHNLETFTPLQLGHVLLSYSMLSRDYTLARKAEKVILNIGRNLSVADCINLMQTFLQYESGEDVWMLFDMIIGKNIRKVHKDQVIPILQSFSKAPFKRDKLFTLFQHKIREFEFTLAENCKIVRTYGEINFKNAEIFEMMDHRLSNKIFEMSGEDITNALIGFLNPKIDKKFQIIANLEHYIKDVMKNMSLHDATILLVRYGQLRKGSKVMVNECLERVYSLTTSVPDISTSELMLIAHGYNLVGAQGKYYYPLLPQIHDKVGEFGYERLNNLSNILSKHDQDETFSKTRIAVKHESEKYDIDGQLKKKY
jgi:hypothetical protein